MEDVKNQLIAQYAFNHADNVVSVRDPHKPTEKVKSLMKQSKEVGHVIAYEKKMEQFLISIMEELWLSILIKCK